MAFPSLVLESLGRTFGNVGAGDGGRSAVRELEVPAPFGSFETRRCSQDDARVFDHDDTASLHVDGFHPYSHLNPYKITFGLDLQWLTLGTCQYSTDFILKCPSNEPKDSFFIVFKYRTRQLKYSTRHDPLWDL